ncbi:hypothetical protein G9A89_006024 [Geosiphon pyriformis]|nr:hypothetical protein G9A89_006024 [Geosiphon pyriformis]
MFKKKAPKGALYGPVSGTFSQKKKVFVDNIKHSEDEREILLVRLGISESMYSDMDSEFNNNEAGGFVVGSNGGFLLGSAASTSKARKRNNGLISGSPVGIIDFEINEKVGSLLPSLNFSLDKKWIDSKIVKTQIEVLVKKSFALDINLSAMEEKSATAKT